MGQLQLWLCVHSQAREGCSGREPTGKVEAGWQGGLAVGRCGLRLGWGGWSFPPVGSAGGGGRTLPSLLPTCVPTACHSSSLSRLLQEPEVTFAIPFFSSPRRRVFSQPFWALPVRFLGKESSICLLPAAVILPVEL